MGSWPEGVPLPPKPVKPEGVEDWEWEHYQNMDPKWIKPELREKVERAMGWKDNDVVDAREIAERVGEMVRHMDEAPDRVLAVRIRAALRLLENEHITPQGRRIIEKILDEYE